MAENEEKRELTRVNAELRAQLAELKHKLSKDTFEGEFIYSYIIKHNLYFDRACCMFSLQEYDVSPLAKITPQQFKRVSIQVDIFPFKVLT